MGHVGADGLAIISHRNATDAALEVTHCNDVACTAATHNTLENGQGNAVGSDASLAIGTDGLAIISHRNDSSDVALEVTHTVVP